MFDLLLIRKIYTSPGGIVIRKTDETKYWVKSAASGALKGLLLAKTEEKGSIPSRPSSWITVRGEGQGERTVLLIDESPRPWENWLDKILPSVDNAMKQLRAYGIYTVKIQGLRKQYATQTHPFCCRTE